MLDCMRRHAWKVLLWESCLSREAIVLFLRGSASMYELMWSWLLAV